MAFRPLAAPPTQPTSGFRPLPPPPAPQETGPKPFFGTFGRNLKQELDERTKRATEARSAFQRGEQGLPQTALQLTGGVAGAFTTAPVVAAFQSAPKTIFTPVLPVKKALATLFKPVSKSVQAAGDKLAETDFIKNTAAKFPKTGTSPLERDIAAIGDLANLLPAPKAAALAGDAATTAATKSADMLADGTKALKQALPEAAPFQSSYLPQVEAAFLERGIKPPVSAITKSPFVRGLEAVTAKSAFGAKVTDEVVEASQKIDDLSNGIVQRIKPMKSVSDENLGKTIQEGLREYEQVFKETQDKVYTEFSKKYGSKATAEATDTHSVLQSILAQQGRDFYKGTDSRLVAMFEKLDGETKAIKDLRKDLHKDGYPENFINDKVNAQKTRPIMSFDELKATRTSVGEQLAYDPENGALKRLYGALSADMDRAVAGVDKKAAAVLGKINEKYKSGKQSIESRIAQSIDQSNPERIAQNIITRNSAETLRTVKEMIGEKRFVELRKAFLRTQLDSAIVGKKDPKFSVDQLKKNLADYDEATLVELFGEGDLATLRQAIGELEQLKALDDALAAGRKMAEGSQTAFLSKTSRMVAAGTALVTGGVGPAVNVIATLAGDYALARLFTSTAGRKFLTRGYRKSIADFLKKPTPARKPILPTKGPTVLPDTPPF